MSYTNRSSAAQAFEMPETFSFGLEERSPGFKAIKLEIDDDPDCAHEWFKRDKAAQTLEHEGKTILECRGCKKSVAVYEWKLESYTD